MRAQFEQLIASFNRGNLDVPDGFLTPQTTFSLNGRSYESMLGRSSDDPLIRLLTQGVAAYRSAAKALQYALPSAVMTIDELTEESLTMVAQLRVQGRLRDSGEPFEARCSLRMQRIDRGLASVAATVSEDALGRLSKSRFG